MKYTKEKIDIICDMSLTPAEAGQLIGRKGNAVRRSRQLFIKKRLRPSAAESGTPP